MFQKISSFEVWHFVSQAMALILYTDSGYCSMEDINEDRGEDIETRLDFTSESMFTNVTNNTRFQSCEDEEDTSDDETFREYLKRAEECLSGRYRGDSSERLSLVMTIMTLHSNNNSSEDDEDTQAGGGEEEKCLRIVRRVLDEDTVLEIILVILLISDDDDDNDDDDDDDARCWRWCPPSCS